MKSKYLLIFFLAFFPFAARAQGISYMLPSTTFVLEVDAVQVSFTPGPYAAYALQYLGVEAPDAPFVRTGITEIRMGTRVEADLAATYSIASQEASDRFLAFSSQGLVSFQHKAEAGDQRWRFPAPDSPSISGKGISEMQETQLRTYYKEVQTDTALVRIPVQEEVTVQKTLEKRAAEAARMLLDARKERFNIASGNTDATFSGEALGSALRELDRIEREMMELFYGTTVRTPLHETYTVTPSASVRPQRYIAFRLSDADGLMPEGVTTGDPCFLELDVRPVPEDGEAAVTKAREFIHYRIPAVCTVRLTDGVNPFFQTEAPVYQLGRDCTYPIAK